MSTQSVRSFQDSQGKVWYKNLGNAVDPQSPATLAQVLNLTDARKEKDPCVVRTQANIDLTSMPASHDTVTFISNDRIFVDNPTDTTKRGIYIFNGTGNPATRSTDMNTAEEFNNALFKVLGGTDANTQWKQNTLMVTLGVDVPVFSAFVGSGGGDMLKSENLSGLSSNPTALSNIGAEAVANKSTDTTLAANSDTLYPSQKAIKAYVDASVAGMLQDQGSWDASSNLFPTTGSGPAGAVAQGDFWYVSVPGTLATKLTTIGDSFRALVDTPGQTASNWNVLETNIGFVPENVANKDVDGTLAANSDTLYPSQKAVKTYADTKQPALGFTPEDVANKDTDGTLAANSDTKYASQKATKTYADTKQTALGFTPENSANKNATNGYPGLAGFAIQIKNAANTFISLISNTNTAIRSYTLRDRDGVLVDDTDLATKVTANGAITGATKTKITYDSKGLITAGADATQDDIGDGTTYKQFSDTKLSYISVTQAVDLDAIESRVNELDAAVILKGSWDASTGVFPGAGVAQAGWAYINSFATEVVIDGIAFNQFDRIVALADNASTTVYATNWLIEDYTDRVLSVQGATGAVELGAVINGATEKTTPVNADFTGFYDSVSGLFRKISWANIRDTVLAAVTNTFVYGKTLSGYSSGAGTVADGDTLTQVINKLNGNTATKATDSLVVHLASSETVTGLKKFIVAGANSDAEFGDATAIYGDSANPSYGYNATLVAGDWKYMVNGFAVLVQVDTATGSLIVYTAPSGTAGNSISWTVKETLTTAGALALAGAITGSNLSGTNTGDNAANSNSDLVHITGSETITGLKTCQVSGNNSSLKVHQVLSMSGDASNGACHAFNAVLDAGTWKYITTGFAQLIQFDYTSGGYAVYTAPSGSAGASISWTVKQSMTSGVSTFQGGIQSSRITPRVSTEASNATPSINTDNIDCHYITALAADITSLTLTGTPTNSQEFTLSIKDNNTNRTLALSSGSIVDGEVHFPVNTKTLGLNTAIEMRFKYSSAISAWKLVWKSSYTDARLVPRSFDIASEASSVINVELYDVYEITAQTPAFDISVTGVPTRNQKLIVSLTDDGTSNTITWSSDFEASGNQSLPTATVAGVRLDVAFIYNSVTSKWRCLGVS